jgi:hypothetical protein
MCVCVCVCVLDLYVLSVLQGVATCIGGYDLVSGVRQGRVDVKSPPVALMFSRDGSLLVVATAVRARAC